MSAGTHHARRGLAGARPLAGSSRALAGRPVAWALGALTALAAALRLPFRGAQSLWFDETFTANIVRAPSIDALWRAVETTESTPPLFYLLTLGWTRLTGSGSEAALRTVSGVAAVAAVPLAYLALRRLAGPRAAMAAAALTAVSPVLTWYALDARAYALLVVMSLLSVWAFGALLERASLARGALWALAAAAAIWTHYFAVFLVAGEALALAVVLRRRGELRTVAAWCAAVAVAVAPLVPLVAAQRNSRSDFIGDRPLADRVEATVRQLAMGPNVPSAALEVAGLALALGGVLAGAVLLGRRAGARPWIAGLVAVPLGVPILLALTGVDDHVLMRNLLVAWPGIAALAGAGLLRLRGVPLGAYVAVAVAAGVLVAADWRYQKTDWRGVADVVRPAESGTAVVVYPSPEASVAREYLPRLERVPGATAERLVVLVEPARTGRRELEPVTGTPAGVPPAFRLVGEQRREGFRILRFEAPAPTPVDVAALGPDGAGRAPALLAAPSG
jgi:mannosyltransferase